MGSDPQYIRYPDLSLAQHVFNLSNSYTTSQIRSASVSALQAAIREHAMAPLYKHLAHPVEGILNGGGVARERSMSVQLERLGGAPAAAAGVAAAAGAVVTGAGAAITAAAAAGAAAATATANRAVSPAASAASGVAGSGTGVPGQVIVSNMLAPKKLGGMSSTQIKDVTLPWDEKLYKELEARNDEELAKLEKEQEEVAESGVESDVQAVIGKKAEFYAKIGDKDKSIQTFESILSSTSLLGTKIDILLAQTRIGLFFGDKSYVQSVLDRATTLVESGGDWDRRNRLKAYKGLHLLTARNYAAAAPLLLDSLATFTSYELCSYSELVVFSVMAGSLALKRVDFKSKVVDAPEIKAILGDGEDRLDTLASGGNKDEEMKDAPPADADKGHAAIVNLTTLGTEISGVNVDEAPVDFSPLANLVSALYNGSYKFFFQSLAAVEDSFLKVDRYLFEHRAWFVREMRLRGYTQLLQSYRVVGLQSMADAFGVSVDYLDRDLAKFIASDRIACTIDRVNGIIETNRADDKNKQYADVVKQGDALITKLQKYGQAVRMRGSERA
ncbi:proteasome regulatory particle subunit [Ascosphaera apis ARSEF 7405]|uniref:Proteasome regulatory particle subunit n=1 Tax=Ascosphaera apis ARSEF 7405 TaxID=392613 RepID=A0A167W1T3_9EURO|nr:proteasome regulatory particle subunit [Ascosphaera apis ARSEF 7405]